MWGWVKEPRGGYSLNGEPFSVTPPKTRAWVPDGSRARSPSTVDAFSDTEVSKGATHGRGSLDIGPESDNANALACRPRAQRRDGPLDHFPGGGNATPTRPGHRPGRCPSRQVGVSGEPSTRWRGPQGRRDRNRDHGHDDHPFSGDHRERVSVERTPFPPPGTVTSSDGTRGVLVQRGAMPLDRAMLHSYTRARTRATPYMRRRGRPTAGILTAESRSLVILTPLPA